MHQSDVLLRNIIGDKFDAMPPAVKRMHDMSKTQRVHGISRVMGGKNFVSHIIRIIAFLPKPVHRAPIHIDFVKYPEAEGWDRHFGTSRFHTIMRQEGAQLAEKMVNFPVTFIYNVHADNRGFSLHVVRVKFCGIPLPKILWPSLKARAGVWRGRYRFSTMVGFWFCGRVISYFGYLDAPQ